MKRTLLILSLILASTAVFAQEPTTGREYYQEIKDAGGIPKWAVNVCYVEHGNTEAFILTSTGNSAHPTLQWFYNGVGYAKFSFTQGQRGLLTFRGTANGKPLNLDFGVNWLTGRFAVGASEDRGVCEAIQ